MALFLSATTEKVQLITSAAADIEVHRSYAINNAGSVTVSSAPLASITTATTTDIVPAPASGEEHNVKHLNIRNNHASAACDVTVQVTDGTNTATLQKVTLLAGESLTFDETGTWRHLAVNGGEYAPAVTITRKVTVADQAIGASVTNYITGSDIDASNPKVGTVFRWKVCLSKTAAATAAHTLDVRWGTAGTTGDTSRQSQATGTQTAVADVGEYEIELVVRAIGASGNFHGKLQLAHSLNATGFDNARAVILTQALSANFDMTATGLKVGLSLTTGVSHALTVQQVIAERVDL